MTLPQLHRLLLTHRLDALVAVPASLDPGATERHFAGAEWRGGRMVYPNGSTVRIFRGSDAPPGSLEGLALDVAVVLTPWPATTLSELCGRLLPRDGYLFAPFAEEPAVTRRTVLEREFVAELDAWMARRQEGPRVRGEWAERGPHPEAAGPVDETRLPPEWEGHSFDVLNIGPNTSPVVLDYGRPVDPPATITQAIECDYSPTGPRMRFEDRENGRITLTLTEPDGTRREWASVDKGRTWVGDVRDAAPGASEVPDGE